MNYLKDWHNKPIDAITRTDVQERFNTISKENGPYAANRTIGLLRRIYRAPCTDNETLRNPVRLWQAGGGRLNKKGRRKIDPPADILPKWHKGFEAARNKVIRDAIDVGLYTGMRLREVLWLKWFDTLNDIDQLTWAINSTPRKCLGFKTPAEASLENITGALEM